MSTELYRRHRRALMKQLPDGLIVLAAAPELVRNGDVRFAYRQSSDLLYLSGVSEPGCVLVLDPARGSETLFVPRLSQAHAVWLGHIPSAGEARDRFGIRSVRYRDELAAVLKARAPRLVHADAFAAPLVRKIRPSVRLRRPELRDALDDLRLVKDEGELALLRRASAATAVGHLAAMRFARAGLYEYQVQAELERQFRHAGGTDLGYTSIVATGRNGAVLHYHANSARLRRGELLLIDAGSEYRGYTADVTRSFPVSGRFSARQRDVYSIVLETQARCIDFARAGNTSMDLQRLAERRLAEGLRDLRLLHGSLDELTQTEAVRLFFPTASGIRSASTSTIPRAARPGGSPRRRRLASASGRGSSRASSSRSSRGSISSRRS